MKPIVCLAGATGTGKSAAALALAERFSGVIINADSRQTYRDFPIITAQPDTAEQASCPHRLYGFLQTADKLSAGSWRELAVREIETAAEGGSLAILVGGTGLYLQTLTQGIAPIPPVPPETASAWEERLSREGPQALHRVLVERDPDSARRLHPNDGQRITRALAVLEGTGKPLGHWHSLPLPPPCYRALFLRLDMPLEELTPHLAARIEKMLMGGALEEAQKALEHCADPGAPGWSGIGCAELFQHLAGKISLDACRALWLKNTRAYAKRQITWFRHHGAPEAFAPDDTKGMLTRCATFLAANGP